MIRTSTRRLGTCDARIALLSVAFICVAAHSAWGQDEPLYERQPFDRIVLKQGGPQGVLDVQSLNLPNHQVPNPFPAGMLRVRLTDPTKAAVEYEVPWSNIARIELYEDMLMAEGQRLVKAGQYDEAYDYFAQLVSRFPNAPGLDAAINGYLLGNAMAAFRGNEFDRALAILGALHDRKTNDVDLTPAIDNVAGRIIEQQLRERNYKAARQTLDVVAQTFADLPLTIVDAWRTRFQQAAATQMKAAQEALARQDFTAARAAVDQAVGVWPEIAGSRELLKQVQQAHPVVTVGVFEAAPAQADARLDSWPHLRVAELQRPRLAGLVDYSAEGGVYRSPVGSIEVDDTGLSLTITLAAGNNAGRRQLTVATAAVARELVRAAAGELPTANPALKDLIRDVEIQYPDRVRLRLHRPHVRPEALLRLPLPDEVTRILAASSYELLPSEGDRQVFAATARGIGNEGIAEVHEVAFASEDEATAALLRGQVDIIDRVPPWQVDQLSKQPSIQVVAYALPSVHVLIPVSENPLVARREFRRALCYGIDRQSLVDRVLLGDQPRSGYTAVSGPFAGRDSGSDLVPYAYNSAVKPRDFDPRLASMLMTVAWTAVQPKVEKGQTPPPLPPLPKMVLAHGKDPVARAACRSIAAQLKILGLELQLIELSADKLVDPTLAGVDFRYAELFAWEPVADARELLGPGSTLPATTDFMVMALDRLDMAQNWNDVRTEMYNIHQIAAGDLPVLPLWQTRNHFARRRQLEGVADRTVSLYQDLGDWRINFDRE